MRTLWIAGLWLIGAALTTLVGCGPSASKPENSASHPSAPVEQSMDVDIQAALAQLSDEDRALAVKQRICPVSGNPLGSMGKPVEVNVKGQRVFLCCEGCREEIEKDPDKYLAKIGK
jgi:hypothetical protein